MPKGDPGCCRRAGCARLGWGRERCRELQSPSRPSQPCLAGCPWGHFGAAADGEGSASGNCLLLPSRREEEEDSPGALNPPLPLLSSFCSTREHQAGLDPGSAAPTAAPSAPHPPKSPCRDLARMRRPRDGRSHGARSPCCKSPAQHPPRCVSGVRIPAPIPPSSQGKRLYRSRAAAGAAPPGAVS